MLDEGIYPHQSALARGEGVTAAAASLGLRHLREHDVARGQVAGAEGESRGP